MCQVMGNDDDFAICLSIYLHISRPFQGILFLFFAANFLLFIHTHTLSLTLYYISRDGRSIKAIIPYLSVDGIYKYIYTHTLVVNRVCYLLTNWREIGWEANENTQINIYIISYFLQTGLFILTFTKPGPTTNWI